jgi:hypothetical protein
VKIPRADYLRMALAPMHLVVGATLVRTYVTEGRVALVGLLGLLFLLFGGYRIYLIARALRS